MIFNCKRKVLSFQISSAVHSTKQSLTSNNLWITHNVAKNHCTKSSPSSKTQHCLSTSRLVALRASSHCSVPELPSSLVPSPNISQQSYERRWDPKTGLATYLLMNSMHKMKTTREHSHQVGPWLQRPRCTVMRMVARIMLSGRYPPREAGLELAPKHTCVDLMCL